MMSDENRGISTEHVDRLLKGGGDFRQISPDANGFVLKSGGADIGYIKVDETAGELTFLWTSTSTAWPAEFDLVAPTSSLPSAPAAEVYEHASFPTTTAAIDVSTCDYEIIQNSSVIGYLKRGSSSLDWYATSSAPSGGYFTTDPITFKSHSASGTQSLHHIKDDLLP